MSVYPGAIPSSGDLPDAGANLSSNPHSSLHDDVRDEVIAIATELGVEPSGTAATVRARLDAGLGLRQIVTFTSDGTFTKASYPWLRAVRVKVQAGGGGSAGCGANDSNRFGGGSGGGGGGYAESFVLATDLPATVPVTVGGGGAGGAPAANGVNGNPSQFGDTGTYRTAANGGEGGFEASNRTDQTFRVGGIGGAPTHGQIQIRGGPGSSPNGTAATFFMTGGNGGDSQLGAGGRHGAGPGANAHSPGFAGNLYGGGGGGPCSRGTAGNIGGNPGAAGIVIVELYA